MLRPARAGHPWEGRIFTAGWGSREVLDIGLVVPELVAEVSADVARDAAGRWRHPVRSLRLRPDLTPADPRGGTPATSPAPHERTEHEGQEHDVRLGLGL